MTFVPAPTAKRIRFASRWRALSLAQAVLVVAVAFAATANAQEVVSDPLRFGGHSADGTRVFFETPQS